MEDPTTIAINLTFFGTLGVAFVMFLGLFAVFVATLVIAGIARLAAVIAVAAAGGVARAAGTAAAAVRPAAAFPQDRAATVAAPANDASPSKRPWPARSGQKEAPQLSADWAAAVARADARAAALAEAEAVPAVKVSVRDLPSPTAPAQEIPEVAPLVESATDRNGEVSTVPRAFKKPPAPAGKSLLETVSPTPVPGKRPSGTAKRPVPARDRKAG